MATKITEIAGSDEYSCAALTFIVQYTFKDDTSETPAPQFLIASESFESALAAWRTQDGCSKDQLVEDHGSYCALHEDWTLSEFSGSMIFVVTEEATGYDCAAALAFVATQIDPESLDRISQIMNAIWE
jgi:hypothetical protein